VALEDAVMPSPTGPSKLRVLLNRVFDKLAEERPLFVHGDAAVRDVMQTTREEEREKKNHRKEMIMQDAMHRFIEAGHHMSEEKAKRQNEHQQGVAQERSEPRSLPSQYVQTPGYWTDEMAVYPHFTRRMRLHVTGTARYDTFYSGADKEASIIRSTEKKRSRQSGLFKKKMIRLPVVR
jgi:hypothetical protein